MAWLGRDLKDHPVPTPCGGQGHLPAETIAANPASLGTSRDGPSTAQPATPGFPSKPGLPARYSLRRNVLGCAEPRAGVTVGLSLPGAAGCGCSEMSRGWHREQPGSGLETGQPVGLGGAQREFELPEAEQGVWKHNLSFPSHCGTTSSPCSSTGRGSFYSNSKYWRAWGQMPLCQSALLV